MTLTPALHSVLCVVCLYNVRLDALSHLISVGVLGSLFLDLAAFSRGILRFVGAISRHRLKLFAYFLLNQIIHVIPLNNLQHVSC